MHPEPVPFDDDDMYDVVDEMFAQDDGADHEESASVGGSRSGVESQQQPQRKKSRVELHSIKGKLTPLHQNFEFPKMTCSQLVHNWFIGNPNLKSIHYQKLTSSFLEHVKYGKATKQKMGRFMAVVEFYARIENCWNDNYNAWNAENVSQMWNKIGNKHIYCKYGGKDASRSVTATWRSMLCKFERKGAFRRSLASCKLPEEWDLSIYNSSRTT